MSSSKLAMRAESTSKLIDIPRPLTVLDLFSGIGGFSLGLERTGGFRTVAFCEIDPFCRKVLAKHWPDVPIHEDVTKLRGEDVGSVDVICGGFPCQDVSLAGQREGLSGRRSGLWGEYARLIGEIRPQYVIVENTPGLLSLGMGTVFGDLATLGYDAEWHCIPASAVGADHIRDRVWIIAYIDDGKSEHERRSSKPSSQMVEDAPDIVRKRLSDRFHSGTNIGDAGAISARLGFALNAPTDFPREYRQHQPVVGRGVSRIPNRVDRIKALGNAVVPQVVEVIGHAILSD